MNYLWVSTEEDGVGGEFSLRSQWKSTMSLILLAGVQPTNYFGTAGCWLVVIAANESLIKTGIEELMKCQSRTRVMVFRQLLNCGTC